MAEADEEARGAILRHHRELVDGVRSRSAAMTGTDPAGEPYAAARAELIAYLSAEVLTHAAAEEATLYPAAGRAGLAERVGAMTAEHRRLEQSARALAGADDAAAAAEAARAFEELFADHVAAENDFVLPALVSAADVSLADLLSAMHEAYTAARNAYRKPSSPAGADGDPELDVRELPPARRHQVIFGAYATLRPAAGFVLVNDHDPKPLRYQFAAERPGEFTWDYLESGPAVWRVRIGKPAAPEAA